MATNRTVPELLQMFREGLSPLTITSAYFRDMIQSLHPSTGLFADLPPTPGSVQPGMLWLNGDILQMSLGGGPLTRLGSFRGAGNAGLVVANPRQRMQARTQYGGRGSFAGSATVFTPSLPSQPTTFSDDFNSFDTNKWFVDSYDDGGAAFWSNDPADVADVFTFSGGRLNFAILDRATGGKSFTSGIADTISGNVFEQNYGYWEVSVAVDRYPGLLYQMDIVSSVSGYLPSTSVARIWTDASNVQHILQFSHEAPPLVETDSDSGWDASVSHAYGLEWTASAINFYRDRVLAGSFGNPGGPYSDGSPCYVRHFLETDYASVAGDTVDPGGLPKYAHVDSIKVWASRPF